MASRILIIALLLLSQSSAAAMYEGKKFKLTITKDKATGERTVEGEVWDTTRSEHQLIIKTAPPAPAPVEPVVDPRWDIRPK